jgi:pimeloyl-ACP methyl ester carboxylesterase
VLSALDAPLWDAGGPGIIGFELAGSEGAADRILFEWGQDARDTARISLWLDFAFLVAYGTFWATVSRTRALSIAAIAAAACDAIENVFLLLVLGRHGGALAPVAAAGFATAKFVLLAVVVGAWLIAVLRPRPRLVLAAVAVGAVFVAVSVVVADRDTAPARADGGRVVELPQGDVHVRDDGSPRARALLLVHGFGVSGRWWDRVVPRLSRRFRVVRVDLLGHGASEKPRAGYAMERQADAVAAAARALGVRRATVVGHSMGGMVATALAERHRALVGRLMVIGTSPVPPDVALSPLTPAFLPVTGHLARLYARRDTVRWVLERGLRPEVDLDDAQVADVDAITYRAFSQSVDAMQDFREAAPLDERLRRARAPVTAVFGASDEEAGYEGRYLRVPGSALRTIPGAGHSPMLDQPERMASVIEELALRAR